MAGGSSAAASKNGFAFGRVAGAARAESEPVGDAAVREGRRVGPQTSLLASGSGGPPSGPAGTPRRPCGIRLWSHRRGPGSPSPAPESPVFGHAG